MTNYIRVQHSGEYLGIMRSWIQRKFRNGEYVTWGSTDVLDSRSFTVYELEYLAYDIRNAVLREFGVKDKDHIYKYTIFCHGHGTFIQQVDTPEEAWSALFKLDGGVSITLNTKEGKHKWEETLFQGDAEEARAKVRKIRTDKDLENL